MIYVCDICGWEYDESAGLPEQGIAPGTQWDALPEDFVCTLCGAGKADFRVKEGSEVAPAAPAKAFDPKVTRNFSYGLFVLTARDGDKDNGCIINTAIQAASEPLRVSIAVNKANYTHDMIMKTGEFNISFLSEASRFATYRHFGFQSGRDVDKMASISFRRAANGIAYLTEETNAYLSGKVVQSIDLGSHTMFIAEVTGGEVLSKDPSVTYAYYFSHIKPKPEPKQAEKKGWVCLICGYIYEGEELPADFICPICKHPASDFKKL
jgi:flavin reductase (DIM6/NTAB) family NADH-FMN oxidoreductase RutF/rubredoxin